MARGGVKSETASDKPLSNPWRSDGSPAHMGMRASQKEKWTGSDDRLEKTYERQKLTKDEPKSLN